MTEEEEAKIYLTVDDKDPMRCQGIINTGSKAGQCSYKACPGSKYCPVHGGMQAHTLNQKYKLAKYRLQQYGERVAEFANDDDIKSLREEIGILRMTLETLMNSLTNQNKLILFIDKIQQLVSQIQKTIESAQRMEEKTNTLIDRKVIVVIADSMVGIVGEFIKDPDVLNVIAEKFCASIEAAASVTNPVGAVA